MEGAPPVLQQQTAIGHVVGERMLEGVLQVREQPCLIEELGLPQATKPLPQCRHGTVGDRGQDRERHILADYRGGLQQLLVLCREPIDPRCQDRQLLEPRGIPDEGLEKLARALRGAGSRDAAGCGRYSCAGDARTPGGSRPEAMPPRLFHEVVQQRLRIAVDPVEVFDDQQQRLHLTLCPFITLKSSRSASAGVGGFKSVIPRPVVMANYRNRN